MNIYCFSTLSFAKLQFKSVINKAFHKHGVASFTDAWIETRMNRQTVLLFPSHLLQMRGLKRKSCDSITPCAESHLLQMRGLKLHNGSCRISHSVASFTDAWIETSKHIGTGPDDESHLLQMRGLKRQKMLR